MKPSWTLTVPRYPRQGAGRPKPGPALSGYLPRMSMRWDPLLAAATARELDSRLGGSRVRALMMDTETRRLFLFLRERTLVLELHPLRGWLSLLPPREPLSGARPFPFTIRGVSAPPDESAMVVALSPVRGQSEPLEIVLEMIGNRWNALIVGQRSRTIRHLLVPREDRVRSLTVGSAYQLPTSTERMGRDSPLDQAQWQEAVGSVGEAVISQRAEILRRVAWTSSLNVDTLLGQDGWRQWERLIDPEGWGAFLIHTTRGPQPYPAPLEPTAPGAESEDLASPSAGPAREGAQAFPNLIEAFHAGRELDPTAEPIPALFVPPGLLSELERRLKEARGKVRGLKREWDQTRDPEVLRALGDLILARLSEIPRGAERTTVSDFEGKKVELELDPALSPSANANRCYTEAARLQRAREALPRLTGEAEEAVEKWAAILEGVQEGGIEPGALSSALGPARTLRRGTSGGKVEALPYRRFVSSGGLEIRVGRGARQNDALTFHNSAPTDIWLHARQARGAHVILRWNGEGSPPRQELAEAATLAALYSSARHSGSVPVAWTRRKYVRKRRGASPGTVVPERVETVFVAPDPALIERLAADG